MTRMVSRLGSNRRDHVVQNTTHIFQASAPFDEASFAPGFCPGVFHDPVVSVFFVCAVADDQHGMVHKFKFGETVMISEDACTKISLCIVVYLLLIILMLVYIYTYVNEYLKRKSWDLCNHV